MSPETADLLFFGLDHGIDSVREGGPLIPFVVAERNGERALARYVAETLEAGIAHAVDSIKTNPADRSVLVYDGYLTMPNGERFDAIYAEAIDAAGVVTRDGSEVQAQTDAARIRDGWQRGALARRPGQALSPRL